MKFLALINFQSIANEIEGKIGNVVSLVAIVGAES